MSTTLEKSMIRAVKSRNRTECHNILVENEMMANAVDCSRVANNKIHVDKRKNPRDFVDYA
jgi:hypothetical protein